MHSCYCLDQQVYSGTAFLPKEIESVLSFRLQNKEVPNSTAAYQLTALLIMWQKCQNIFRVLNPKRSRSCYTEIEFMQQSRKNFSVKVNYLEGSFLNPVECGWPSLSYVFPETLFQLFHGMDLQKRMPLSVYHQSFFPAESWRSLKGPVSSFVTAPFKVSGVFEESVVRYWLQLLRVRHWNLKMNYLIFYAFWLVGSKFELYGLLSPEADKMSLPTLFKGDWGWLNQSLKNCSSSEIMPRAKYRQI